ncbi:hypothetical protein Y032_0020g131 [Ancylostoma ceylanicum]|nr:hypothetical protein Y032_0020g131 [Ancylostoma ceylanicum]
MHCRVVHDSVWSRRGLRSTVVHTKLWRTDGPTRLIFEFSLCCAVSQDVMASPEATGPPPTYHAVLREQYHLPLFELAPIRSLYLEIEYRRIDWCRVI